MLAQHAIPAARSTHTDEHIQQWSDVYVDKRVRDYGVHLEFFLIDPQRILEAIDKGRMLRLDEMTSPRQLLAETR